MKIPVKFEFFSHYNYDLIEQKAIELGWLENKVMVKRFMDMHGGYFWTIEPYEEGCNCPNLVQPPVQAV